MGDVEQVYRQPGGPTDGGVDRGVDGTGVVGAGDPAGTNNWWTGWTNYAAN